MGATEGGGAEGGEDSVAAVDGCGGLFRVEEVAAEDAETDTPVMTNDETVIEADGEVTE